MRVKLKKYNLAYDLPKGTEFQVLSQDDGFYTDCPFYAGCVMSSGVKIYVTLDQKDCEVIEYD